MKVKFANKVFEVLYTREMAGLTMYAVEDEPNHIDWLINVEVVDANKKELKKIEQETVEIPFGAKDSELQEATYHIPEGYHAEIEGNKVVIKRGEYKSTKLDKSVELTDIENAILNFAMHFHENRCKPESEWKDEIQMLRDNLSHIIKPKSEWNLSDFKTWQYIVSDVLTKHDGIGQYLDDGFCKQIAKYIQEEWSKKLIIEQKPAEWSEEDENTLYGIINSCQNHL